MSATIDFSPYLEGACKKLWGVPTSEKPQTLKWRLDNYTWRALDRQENRWYDDETKRGGGLLQLAALAMGLPASTKIEGQIFFECWRFASEHWGVPAPPEKAEGNGSSDAAWKFIAEYIYRTESGEPFLRVRKYLDEKNKKQYPQAHWQDGKWANGKPAGAKLPYRLPELRKASPATTIYFCEGEKNVDALDKIGVTATTASEGAAAKWDDALTPHFKDRHVVILPDADEPGRKHAQKVALAINGVAQSLRILDLYPDRNDGSDVANWLEADTAGVKLTQLAKQAPLWEPSPDDGKGDDASAGDDDQLIAELAALPRLQYERRREAAAEKLGVRVSVLDKLVAAARKDEDEQEPSPMLYAHWNVEPADEPVDVGILLGAIKQAIQRYVFMSDDQAVAVTLWIVFSWLHEQVTHSPILYVTSAEKDSGKSTLLGVINFLARRSLQSVDISGPALFRSIAKWQPTLIVDEADDALSNNADLREVINSGWTRGQGVIRCHPDTHEPEVFSTFAPKIVGMKGRNLPDTTLSRSIAITMKPRRPDDPKEHVEDFDHLDNETFARLRSQLARWTADNAEAIAKAKPEIPAGFHNRRRANWVPLLAIEAAGGDWKQTAWKAALAIETVAGTFDPSTGVQLLGAIHDAFQARRMDRITSANLIGDLIADETGPWATWNRGKPISQRQVADLLKPFSIKPRTIKIDPGSGSDETKRGYLFAWFTDAFARFLSLSPADPPISSDTADTDLFSQDFSSFSIRHRERMKITKTQTITTRCRGVGWKRGVSQRESIVAHRTPLKAPLSHAMSAGLVGPLLGSYVTESSAPSRMAPPASSAAEPTASSTRSPRRWRSASAADRCTSTARRYGFEWPANPKHTRAPIAATSAADRARCGRSAAGTFGCTRTVRVPTTTPRPAIRRAGSRPIRTRRHGEAPRGRSNPDAPNDHRRNHGKGDVRARRCRCSQRARLPSRLRSLARQ
jgi:5S rRNA maturation endonuclease (ribonuclease M5)